MPMRMSEALFQLSILTLSKGRLFVVLREGKRPRPLLLLE